MDADVAQCAGLGGLRLASSMGKLLTPFEIELYQRIDEVIHYIWDPIGISDIPQARDEYYSYLPRIFSMLVEQQADDVITSHLLEIERESMGLQSRIEKASAVVSVLNEWRDVLTEKHKSLPS